MAPIKRPRRARNQTYLRNWRKFRGLTQDEAASKIEVDRTTLGRIENGETPYNQDVLEKLALVYLCDPPDLLNIDPLKPDPPKLVYDRLRQAPKDIQERALAVLEALLKAG